jgi:hypothetical protein
MEILSFLFNDSIKSAKGLLNEVVPRCSFGFDEVVEAVNKLFNLLRFMIVIAVAFVMVI